MGLPNMRPEIMHISLMGILLLCISNMVYWNYHNQALESVGLSTP